MTGKVRLTSEPAAKPAAARRRPVSADPPARPFLKWAGGKAQILNEIRSFYPPGLGRSISKYAEPFVGGGAVLFDILSQYRLEAVYISDINRELITAYQRIRDHVEELAAALRTMEQKYLSVANEARRVYYYGQRERFNLLKMESDTSVEAAALFIFLNRTCFNGLYRVNGTGEFNVPMGSHKKPPICDESNLRAVSRHLRKVEIVCADYRQAQAFIDKNTFVYFDPPYRPLSATARFTSYTRDGFDDRNQAELACFIKELGRQGAYVAASNSDPKNTNPNDNFFDELYAPLSVTRIWAGRVINAAGAKRGRVSELLIFNYGAAGLNFAETPDPP
jgi:DNA adenine methylase